MTSAVQKRLAEHPFFKDLRPEHAQILFDCAKEAVFAPNEVIFRQGEPAGQLYLIEKGKVALESREHPHKDFLVQVLVDGDLIGWSWLFPPFLWHFQARSLATTKVATFGAGHLLAACEKDHDFGYEIMKRITRLVISRLQSTRKELIAVREGGMSASG